MDFGGRKSGEWDGGSGKRDRSDDDDHGQPSSRREPRRTLSDVTRDTVVGITNTDESVLMDTGESDAQDLEVLLRKLPPEMRHKIYRGMSPSALNNLRSSSTFFRSDIKWFEIYTGVDSPMRTLINLSRTISPFADAEVEKTTEWHKYNAMRVMERTKIPNPLHALLYVSRMKMLLTDNKFNEYLLKTGFGLFVGIGTRSKSSNRKTDVDLTTRVFLEPATSVVGSSVPWALTEIKFEYTDGERETDSRNFETSGKQLHDTSARKTMWDEIKKKLTNINGSDNTVEIVLVWASPLFDPKNTSNLDNIIQLGVWSVDRGDQEISDNMILNLYDTSPRSKYRDYKTVCGKLSRAVFAVGSSTIGLDHKPFQQRQTNELVVSGFGFVKSVKDNTGALPSFPPSSLDVHAKDIMSKLQDALTDRTHLGLRDNYRFENMTEGEYTIVNIRYLYSTLKTETGRLMFARFEYVDPTFADDKYEFVRRLFSTDGNLYDMPLTLRIRKNESDDDPLYPSMDYNDYLSNTPDISTFEDYRESVTRNRRSMDVLREIGMTSGSKPPLCAVGCENYAAFNCGSHGCSVNYCSVQCADTDWVRGHGMVCRDE